MEETKTMNQQEMERINSQRNKMNIRIFEIENIKAREAEIPGSEDGKKELWVEGYAVMFNTPTVLFDYDGVEIKEQIDPNAFKACKMTDVIFNYNHGGKVLARTRNSTLILEIRIDGLYIRARLDGTEEGRKIYEEIKGGYIDKMSFRWSEDIDGATYDKANHLWTVVKCKRLYDVSAVDIPAYEDTSIEARRNFLDLEATAQEESERKAAAELQKRKLTLQTKLLSM